jgi:hypothetical protein
MKSILFLTALLVSTQAFPSGKCQVLIKKKFLNDSVVFENGAKVIDVKSAEACFHLAYSLLGKTILSSNFGRGKLEVDYHFRAVYNSNSEKIFVSSDIDKATDDDLED